MTLRNMSRYAAAAAVALAVGLTGGSIGTAAPAEQLIPHCAAEDGGPQRVCIWDSAVDGNRQPAAPNNVVILFVSHPGQDPEEIRLK